MLETISAVVLIALSIWLIWTALASRRPKLSPEAEVPWRDLNDRQTRDGLTKFLKQHKITGSAEIRDGFVFPIVPATRLDPLVQVLDGAAFLLGRMSNQDADVLYLRENGHFRMIGIDLSDVREAATVLRRVAEDRKKSRALYRGFSDGEIESMARAGLSQWYKDRGDYATSNEVTAGLYDTSRQMSQAQAVIELLLNVKGARND